jgi:hypothetical protein
MWHDKHVANRPRDPNQLAKLIVDIATGEAEDTVSPKKRTAVPARGRSGGLKGGKARAAKLSAEARKSIARKAAQRRWKRSK